VLICNLISELKNVFGGEQGRSNSVHVVFPVVLGNMANCYESIGKERSSSSAHIS
jgi:hypothetical protein